MANEEQLVKNVSSQFCRIFFDFVPNFLYELAKGIDYVSNSVQNRKLTSIKGEVFKNEKNFILDSKMKNNGRTSEIKSTVVRSGRKDLKEVIKACKNRGIDIYVREKPKNFNKLVERYEANDNLSIREKEMLDAFCDYDKERNIINVHGDGGVLMFKGEDIQQVEEAIKDVDQKSLNIQRRKQKAKTQYKNVKNKIKNSRGLDKER